MNEEDEGLQIRGRKDSCDLGEEGWIFVVLFFLFFQFEIGFSFPTWSHGLD